ncbi:16 kDa phloem protein 1-like isoform X1 [Actinidia eriantha]|uniref:16 kDa phloem protein 1-like isoform X1 n=1 Tax=Actinidia eriantha TaxID=165200 RepID=UPI002585EE63|nr:16 kDa phloem protein 1-like isoform X1 [Actinidia eriantha]
MASGIMEVVLVNAKGLKNSEFWGFCCLNMLGDGIDPYVVLKYKGQERKSRVIRGAGRNPIWNEKFKFRVEYPGGDNKYKLILSVMDKDTFTSDDFLGQATIYLKDLLALGVENGSAELPPSKYKLVASDQRYCGEIQVGVTFTPKVQEEADEEEELGGWKESEY